MRRFALAKSSLLTKPWEYRLVYQQGVRLRGGEALTLHLLPNEACTNRLGISVHGVKSAVRRNRIKRLVREYFRLQRQTAAWGLPPEADLIPLDVVFAIRKEFTPGSLQELEAAVRRLLRANRGKLPGVMKRLQTGRPSRSCRAGQPATGSNPLPVEKQA